MGQALLYVYMFVLSLCFSVPVWLLPALVAAILLRRREKLRDKPWQRAYTAAAAAGMFIGALVGLVSSFLAVSVLKIAGLEWGPGQRPHWLDLATPQGALGVGVVLSVVFLLATAAARAIARSRGRRNGSPGTEAGN
jgi:Na+/proline symporter